ncbi:MAG: hypothetical protein M0Z55_06810 [Peptococcaceae bacterium]|nr:hypothetical protein [Peptococcaceae bacterium]
MLNKRKLVATLLVALAILGAALPALAEDGIQSTAPSMQSNVQARQAGIQRRILHIKKAQEFHQYLQPIRQVQAQEIQVRQQLQALRKQVHQQVATDRQSKNYAALLVALNDMLPMQNDITTAQQAASTCRTDWQQSRTDNKAGNIQALGNDLAKIQTDVQTRLTIYQRLVNDLQKISQDLTTTTVSSSVGSTTSATISQ